MKVKIQWILLVLAVVPLSLLLMDTVREYISLPYQQLMQFFYRVDQGLLWFFLIGIVFFIAYRALVKIPKKLPSFRKKPMESRGPVAEMKYLLDMSQSGFYSRDKLLRYLRNTAVQIMALQRRTTEADILRSIESGELPIPLELRPFFDDRLMAGTSPFKESGRIRFKRREKLSAIDIDPLIKYLEKEMDIEEKHGD